MAHKITAHDIRQAAMVEFAIEVERIAKTTDMPPFEQMRIIRIMADILINDMAGDVIRQRIKEAVAQAA